MTTENLLKPRIKMIAPIPKIFSDLEVGEIWEGKTLGGDILFELRPAHLMDLEAVAKYPHLFKILEWHEERKESDMPEYVKNNNSEVYKVQKWEIGTSNCYFKIPVGNGFRTLVANAYLPATQSEYETQNKK